MLADVYFLLGNANFVFCGVQNRYFLGYPHRFDVRIGNTVDRMLPLLSRDSFEFLNF